jgi:hypothetical protein
MAFVCSKMRTRCAPDDRLATTNFVLEHSERAPAFADPTRRDRLRPLLGVEVDAEGQPGVPHVRAERALLLHVLRPTYRASASDVARHLE